VTIVKGLDMRNDCDLKGTSFVPFQDSSAGWMETVCPRYIDSTEFLRTEKFGFAGSKRTHVIARFSSRKAREVLLGMRKRVGRVMTNSLSRCFEQ
jgi:hypothetical protein